MQVRAENSARGLSASHEGQECDVLGADRRFNRNRQENQANMGKESVEKARGRDRDEERRLVTALLDKVDEEGKPYSRSRIIRETGVSGRQVSRIAAEAGHQFDRSSPGLQAMKAANEVDARLARAKISQDVLAEIRLVFEKMHSPHVVVGWFQGEAFEHTLQNPTSGDYKNYATVLGILIDKHLVLERYGIEDGDADSLLSKVHIATEVTRLVKSHPEMSADDIINEVINRNRNPQ